MSVIDVVAQMLQALFRSTIFITPEHELDIAVRCLLTPLKPNTTTNF